MEDTKGELKSIGKVCGERLIENVTVKARVVGDDECVGSGLKGTRLSMAKVVKRKKQRFSEIVQKVIGHQTVYV